MTNPPHPEQWEAGQGEEADYFQSARDKQASLPARQIYSQVLWKWPWILEAHVAGSQRGREEGRSPFPVLQEVTPLLLKKQVYPCNSQTGYERATHGHKLSVSYVKTNTTRSMVAKRNRNIITLQIKPPSPDEVAVHTVSAQHHKGRKEFRWEFKASVFNQVSNQILSQFHLLWGWPLTFLLSVLY